MGRNSITPGLYRHYKGKDYRVLHLALAEDTGTPVVVYIALYDAGQVWVRALTSFEETVTLVDGTACPRFTRIGD